MTASTLLPLFGLAYLVSSVLAPIYLHYPSRRN